ncbi:GNAT family N-acetyltransferase [Ferrimonas lipolytica]|uniref:GNAT family N-acetyltransferase n=1 Tax=Ferrimonas lipolytica TaxID=2724191 RepID=A0A6H1UE07_9GAMM|nr:GNAT family N-acetyltransferase [Ferrimonas lipolytica]QIZ76456.1 GNAT family N-acetyltransferase [Ferrimonas lipolytica]
MIELETERLILRQWRNDDFEPYARLCGDEKIMRYLGGNVLCREDSWRHMAMLVGHWQLKGFGHWAVELKHSGEFIGRIGCLEPEGWPDFELGWTICSNHQRQGLASEGARAALQWAFADPNRQQVISIIHPDNIASKQVALKLGLRFWRKATVKGIEVVIYGITKVDYQNLS